MALQPSTQSWRVICVRAGSSLSAASDQLLGVFTNPTTSSVHSAKSCATCSAYCSVPGSVLPFAGKTVEMSASPYSLASASRGVTTRCTASVNHSVLLRMSGNQLLCVRLSQPDSATRLAAPTVPFKNCLLFMACLGWIMIPPHCVNALLECPRLNRLRLRFKLRLSRV